MGFGKKDKHPQFIEERKQIVDRYYSLGIIDRHTVLQMILSLRLKDERALDGTLARSSDVDMALYEKANDEQLINEIKKQIRVLRSEL